MVHFLDEPFGQLFDLENDPGEVDNLWDDPAYVESKRELLDTCAMADSQSIRTKEWGAAWR